MLDDTPPFGVPIDVISLSNVEDAPIVIPFDIGLDGELDFAFLFFSRLGLGSNILFRVHKSRLVKSRRQFISSERRHAFIIKRFKTRFCS